MPVQYPEKVRGITPLRSARLPPDRARAKPEDTPQERAPRGATPHRTSSVGAASGRGSAGLEVDPSRGHAGTLEAHPSGRRGTRRAIPPRSCARIPGPHASTGGSGTAGGWLNSGSAPGMVRKRAPSPRVRRADPRSVRVRCGVLGPVPLTAQPRPSTVRSAKARLPARASARGAEVHDSAAPGRQAGDSCQSPLRSVPTVRAPGSVSETRSPSPELGA